MTMDVALLVLRIVVGVLFVGHGVQKLFGWFGGEGLDKTTEFMGNLGLYPPRFWAVVAGLAECLGGALLAVGLLTPLASLAIIGVMLMAIIRVHWRNGLWNTNGGAEYPLVLLAIALVLGLVGAGSYGLDARLGVTMPMPQTFAIGLLVVLAVIILALLSGRRMMQTQAQQA